MDYGTYKNNLSVVLTQACTDTDTVLHIDNAGAIPVLNEHGLYLTFVDTNEIVEVTSVDTTNNTITVVRGLTSFGGSSASSHNSGTKLSARVIAEHFDNLENNIENNEATINSHVNNTSNPHNVTASQVGINSTDDIPEGNNNLYYKDSRVSANSDVSANTSARHTHSNKSLLDTYNQSNADITDAVNKKHTQNTDTGTTASEFYIDTNGDNVPVKAHIQNTNNPHNVTASQIGAIAKIEDDTTPKLGGELDAQAHSIGFTLQTYTGNVGTTTIDWTKGNKAKFTFGSGNETLVFTAPSKPCNLLLMVIQDSTGGRTLTFPSNVKWAGGTAPTLSTSGGAIDIISFFYDGVNYYGVASLDFS